MQEIRVNFQQDIYSAVTQWSDAIVMLMMMLLLLYLCVGDHSWRCQSYLQQYHQLAEDSPFFQTLWRWGVKQIGVNMKSFLQKNLLTKARVSWQIQNISRHWTNKHSHYEWTSSYFGVFCGVAQVLQCWSVPERILSNSQQSQIIAQSSVESGS